jgi:hypothetical protein
MTTLDSDRLVDMWRRRGDMVICCSKQEKHMRNCSLAAEESIGEQGRDQGEESDDCEGDQEKEHISEVRGVGSGS